MRGAFAGLLAANKRVRRPSSRSAATAFPIDFAELEQAGFTVKQVVESVPGNPRGGADGKRVRIEATADSPGPVRTRARVVMTVYQLASWDCPDANGTVDGVVLQHEETRVSITNLETGRLIDLHDKRTSFDGRAQAHINDDSTFRDYDLTVETDQGDLQSRWALGHLQLDEPWALEGDDEGPATYIRWGGATGQRKNEFNIDRAAQSVVYSGPGAQNFEARELGPWALAGMAKDLADRMLKEAYEAIVGPTVDCVKLTLSPPGPGNDTLRLTVGKSQTLTVSARSRKDGKLIRSKATTFFELGSVSPEPLQLHAGRLGRISLSASKEGHQGFLNMKVRGRSKRGAMARSLVVTATGVRSYIGTVRGSYAGSSGFGVGAGRETWTAVNLRFDPEPGRPTRFKLTSGTVNWSVEATDMLSGCRGTGSASLSPLGAGAAAEINIVEQGYYGGGEYARSAPVHVVCPQYEAVGEVAVWADWLDTNGQGTEARRPAPDGSLRGSADSVFAPGVSAHWDWDLRPVPTR